MKSKNYEEFVDKFKPKLTTDDCYTLPEIMEIIQNYVHETYDVKYENMVRPFYPGGDYQAEDYNDCVVVDNPPFSILTQIVRWYEEHNIKYFLFAPTLTCTAILRYGPSAIVIKPQITYHNGAKVNTAFITNLEQAHCIRFDRDLSEKIRAAQTKDTKPKYDNSKIVRTIEVQINEIEEPVILDECEFIRNYEGRKIFGGAFINRKELYSYGE